MNEDIIESVILLVAFGIICCACVEGCIAVETTNREAIRHGKLDCVTTYSTNVTVTVETRWR